MHTHSVFKYYTKSSWTSYYHHWIVVTKNKIAHEAHQAQQKERNSLTRLRIKYTKDLGRCGANMKCVKRVLHIMHVQKVFKYFASHSWTNFYSTWIHNTKVLIQRELHTKKLRERANNEKLKIMYT
jgi:hypothetical protein